MVSARSNRLCTILNYQQIISSRDPGDGRHVCGQAIKMHWDNCLGSGCNGHVDLRDIDVARLGVAVHKDWSGACQPDGLRGGEKSVRVRDDFVAGTDAQRHQHEPNGIGAVAHADGVFHAVIGGQLALELFEHRTLDVIAAQQNLLDVGVNFLLQILVLANVSVEFNFHTPKAIWRFCAVTSILFFTR